MTNERFDIEQIKRKCVSDPYDIWTFMPEQLLALIAQLQSGGHEPTVQAFRNSFRNYGDGPIEPDLHCPTCRELYTGRGGQDGNPPILSCPNGHRWPDPRGGVLGKD